MAHSKHRKGDRAELIAAEYFINLGYSVHRNMSQHGPIDLILVDEHGVGDPAADDNCACFIWQWFVHCWVLKTLIAERFRGP